MSESLTTKNIEITAIPQDISPSKHFAIRIRVMGEKPTDQEFKNMVDWIKKQIK